MVLLAFQAYYLLFTLLGIGVVLTFLGILFLFRRKTFPGILVAGIGIACVLLFIFAVLTHPESIPFLNQ